MVTDCNCLAQDEPRIFVESEDQPDRMLLETKISKEDGYQKQQGLVLQSLGQYLLSLHRVGELMLDIQRH